MSEDDLGIRTVSGYFSPRVLFLTELLPTQLRIKDWLVSTVLIPPPVTEKLSVWCSIENKVRLEAGEDLEYYQLELLNTLRKT